MKQGYALLGSVVIAALLTFAAPFLKPQTISGNAAQVFDTEDAIIPQKVIDTSDEEKINYVVYYKDSVIGVIRDVEKLDSLMNTVYKSRYQEYFPMKTRMMKFSNILMRMICSVSRLIRLNSPTER